MFRKNYFTFLLTTFLLLAGSLTAFAQNAPVSGKVVITKADGTTVPAADALVEVFRTDIKGKGPSDKTNKKGDFSFAGLQFGATFVLSVSAPNAKPGYLPGVKAGTDKLLITLSEGDGKRWTEEEIREALSGGATTTNTTTATDQPKQSNEEIKKAMAARAKLEAEYETNKKKTDEQNASVGAFLKEGNDAFTAKNYDLAISKYSEGISASSDVGSAPVFMNNKALALVERALIAHNQGVKAPDAAAKLESYNKAKKDFSDALDSYNASWTLLKNAPAADIKDQSKYQADKAKVLNGFRELLKLMVVTEKVNAEKIEPVETLYAEYATFETDAAKKAETQIRLADAYFIMGNIDKAIAEYRKILASSPDNPDALAGLGLNLVSAGYNADGTINPAMMQEAINNLQRFVEVAPSNHKLKASVAETIGNLKNLNVKPEKTGKKKN